MHDKRHLVLISARFWPKKLINSQILFSLREAGLREHFSKDCWRRRELKRSELGKNVKRKKEEKKKKGEGIVKAFQSSHWFWKVGVLLTSTSCKLGVLFAFQSFVQLDTHVQVCMCHSDASVTWLDFWSPVLVITFSERENETTTFVYLANVLARQPCPPVITRLVTSKILTGTLVPHLTIRCMAALSYL